MSRFFEALAFEQCTDRADSKTIASTNRINYMLYLESRRLKRLAFAGLDERSLRTDLDDDGFGALAQIEVGNRFRIAGSHQRLTFTDSRQYNVCLGCQCIDDTNHLLFVRPECRTK